MHTTDALETANDVATNDTATPPSEPTVTFEDLGLCSQVLAAVRDAGYSEPTPIQKEAIPLALSGRDMIGLAQTGTGKTAAFTLPIIDRLIGGPKRTRVVILTPTRELAAQVDASFQKYGKHSGLGVAAVYGGVPIEPQETPPCTAAFRSSRRSVRCEAVSTSSSRRRAA
jgi:superfamily II DNA/RNA helicase